MPFEYDIFISYGHLDDDPATGAVKGWVDFLVEQLPKQMQDTLGYIPKIWRDEQSLYGNDRLDGAIREGIERSLLFVPVMTPRYVLSDWCRKELEMFCASQPPATASGAAFRSRIFKVIKTPLVLPHVCDKEPEKLRDLIGYEFFKMEGGMPQGLKSDDADYWIRFKRLAWELVQMLSLLKPDMKMPPAAESAPAIDVRAAVNAPAVVVNTRAVIKPLVSLPPAESNGGGAAKPSKFVYLAETTSDVSDERELVRDELQQRGYGVLPERQTKLPLESYDTLAAAVRGYLESCCLSVHLIGAAYGSNPEDGDDRSVVRIQEEVAAEHSAPDFRRLIWMAPGLEVKGQKQKDFVSGLQGKIGEDSELLQTSLEDLKTRIVDKLDPPKPPPPARPKHGEKIKQIYLICADTDSERIWPIKEYLFNQNFEVITKLDGGEGGENGSMMEYHRKYLKECDAALVYFGCGDELWVRTNLEELDKAFGYGREAEWCARGVYVGSPVNTQKKQFLTRMVPFIIRNYSDFDPNVLRDFVSAVQSAEGGRGQC